jgi:translation initiation factor IF-2
MKKFFANIDNGNLYEDPHIKEVEYDHFADKSESVVVGYDGNVLPVGLQRSEKKNIRFSLFLRHTLYDTYEDAENYIKQQLEQRLEEIKPEFEKLQTEIKNIETALKKI